jgi:hypothetical protein
MIDGVECIINQTIRAMRDVFSPTSSQPPLGGGTETVRFLAGEASPMAVVDLHIADCECGKDPFLWVRLLRRYRSRTFPQPFIGDDPCGSPVVVALEIGVLRCAVVGQPDSSLEDYGKEAEISLDDSWRIELAQCQAVSKLKQARCSDMVALDAVVPYGPDGGIIGWTGSLYVRVDT